MELLLELPPYSKRAVDKVASKAGSVFDGYFIPCTPAGVPMLDCLSASIYIVTKYGSTVYCSLRTSDYSLNHMIERIKAASEFGLKGILVTRGDPPKYGDRCADYGTEFVIDYIRKLGIQIDLGLVLSLRFSDESMVTRAMNVKPNFVTIVRFSRGDVERLKKFAALTSALNVRVYVFLLLGFENNITLFESLGQPYVRAEDLGEVLESLRELVNGVIVSSPRRLLDVASVIERVKTITR